MSHRICENIKQIEQEVGNVHLVVVSKYRSLPELEEVYACGHRNFGENRVQETLDKYEKLPKDINWHIIGHLQTNKVKYIAPFVHLIHSVDSLKLLQTIDKEAQKNNRIIPFLFQLHIAQEETKFGLSAEELEDILQSDDFKTLENVKSQGLMGMASLTDSAYQIKKEFNSLLMLYTKHKALYNWDTLSMGMSSDYKLAVECGSTMIRVGSKVFQ
jgi:pyridoxal phosphate enzyme (YggS family)